MPTLCLQVHNCHALQASNGKLTQAAGGSGKPCHGKSSHTEQVVLLLHHNCLQPN